MLCVFNKHTHIYIYIERERERHICIYIYIYIYRYAACARARFAGPWGACPPVLREISLIMGVGVKQRGAIEIYVFLPLGSLLYIELYVSIAPIRSAPIYRNPKRYPHPRLQDFPRWKKTQQKHLKPKSSPMAGIQGWG